MRDHNKVLKKDEIFFIECIQDCILEGSKNIIIGNGEGCDLTFGRSAITAKKRLKAILEQDRNI